MYNEPVGYIVEYEISAILFLSVIMLRYFDTRRFPNNKSRLFALVLWATVAYMILDVLSAWIIDNIFTVPLPITIASISLFHLFNIIMQLMMLAYALAMVDKFNKQTLKRLFPLFIPWIIVMLMLLSNPITRSIFYVDPVLGYVHGDLFIVFYAACSFYMVATFVVAYRNRAKLHGSEFSVICIYLNVVLASVIIQSLYPALLVIGVAIALSVTMMYFTIQNPDTMIDSTTGAFTYDAMLTFLHDRALEHDRVYIVAVKINNMRRINQLLGIENGSLLLSQVSHFMSEGERNLWVFRMRGSCFVAITRKKEDYAALSERIKERIGQPWTVSSTEVMLQATVCCMSADDLPADSISPEETTNYLDTALLQGGQDGELITHITIGPEFMEKFERSRAVEAALRVALESGEGIELYYQPLWSVSRERFVSAEALLRFSHPTLGSISPDEFVPIAESNGLVTAIDELAVRKACSFIKEVSPYDRFGLEKIEINLSALEFMHRRLPKILKGIMKQYQVDPKLLTFEITETAATESFELLRECMQELCIMGCSFALDDFGTGYANISQVIQLPFSSVKLDRSLLLGSDIVMSDMAQMFSRMNKLTVIEGVESAEQAKLAKALDVDYIQGFYYAKPMCQKDFIRFMEEHATTDGSEVYAG